MENLRISHIHLLVFYIKMYFLVYGGAGPSVSKYERRKVLANNLVFAVGMPDAEVHFSPVRN